MSYDPKHPANMSTQEIEEELLRRTSAPNRLTKANFYRIGELEVELERREWDHPEDWGREVARD